MRLASGLLVGTLLTTCAISGTFAKYTTQDSAKDSARVAKWGIELQIIGDLYSDTYGADIRTAYAADPDTDDGAAMEVKADAEGTDVVAPGTKNDTGLAIKLNGTPEVDHQLKVVMATENIYLAAGTYGIMVEVEDGIVTADNYADLVAANDALYTLENGIYSASNAFNASATYYTLEDKVVNDATYFPVVYNISSDVATDNKTNYVNGGLNVDLAGATDGTALDTIDAIAKQLYTKLTGADAATANVTVDAGKTTWAEFTSEVYETNTAIDVSTGLSDVTLSWAWNFTDVAGSDADGNFVAAGEDVDDGLDTILGNLQAGNVNVVKLDTVNNNYKAPVAAAGTNANDYNLETSFSLDITVNQID